MHLRDNGKEAPKIAFSGTDASALSLNHSRHSKSLPDNSDKRLPSRPFREFSNTKTKVTSDAGS